MDKARDDYEEDREVPSEEEDDWPFGDEEDDDWEEDDEYEDIDFDLESIEDIAVSLSLRGGTNIYSNQYFDSEFEGDLVLGLAPANSPFKFNVFGGAKILSTMPDDSVSDSIKADPLQLNAGVEFLYYPFPQLKFFSPFVFGRAGGLYLFWEFKNSLTSGGETISSDYVGGLLLGAGLGVDLIHLNAFFLAVQVLPELYVFGEETNEGFTNDYFSDYFTVRVAFEAGITF